jgi:hypothetical protein
MKLSFLEHSTYHTIQQHQEFGAFGDEGMVIQLEMVCLQKNVNQTISYIFFEFFIVTFIVVEMLFTAGIHFIYLNHN